MVRGIKIGCVAFLANYMRVVEVERVNRDVAKLAAELDVDEAGTITVSNVSSTPPPAAMSGNTSAINVGSNGITSLIISANTEMVRLHGDHLLAMMVDALGLEMPVGDLDIPANWEKVAAALDISGIDIVVFACQECYHIAAGKNPIQKISKRLGKKFVTTSSMSYQFLTITKKPYKDPIDGRITHSMMFIGALVRKSDRKNYRFKKTIARANNWNKGAVMLFMTSVKPPMKIVYSNTHLDAKSPDNRLADIEAITGSIDEMNENCSKKKTARSSKSKLDAEPYDHVYIFGDLNYRLAAPLPQEPELHCRQCIQNLECDKSHLDIDESNRTYSPMHDLRLSVAPQCFWCHSDLNVNDGVCLAEGLECPEEKPHKVLQILGGSTDNGCRTPLSAPWSHYIDRMYSGGVDSRGQMRTLYDRFKEEDTLFQSQQVWTDRDYTIPDYTEDTLPTYKKYKSGEVNDMKYYELKKLFETSHGQPHNAETIARLTELTRQAYTLEADLKPCEQVYEDDKDPHCVDFGWLDRLVYKGRSEISYYKTLKLSPTLTAGDHTPLAIRVQSL